MKRSILQWTNMDPKAVSAGSQAQVLLCIEDARSDILELFNENLDAAAELRSRKAPYGWLPVDTAPTGPRIVVGYRHKGGWVLRVARRDEIGATTRWLTEPGSMHIDPTHWLPTAPPDAG